MTRPTARQHGFTLIELLIAISLMAILAGLSWRGIDSLMRSRDITQAQVNKIAEVQTVLAQWQADLNALHPIPGLNAAGVSWDGQTLRLTRRATAWRTDGRDGGLWVVGWTLRNNQWIRWQSPTLIQRSAIQQAWEQVERWGKNPGSDDLTLETPLIPLEAWQLTYFRGNTWTHPLSSATGNSPTPEIQPDAIRLQLDLPADSGLRGRLTLDWVKPHFSNTKS